MDRGAGASQNVLERMLLDERAEPTQLPLSLLEDITNHFSLDHEIGRGGFAVVYKGIVGQGMVAVKKLSNTFGIHENNFQEEIKCLIQAKHENIVRFLGYCADTQGKIEEHEGKHVMAEQRNFLLCFEYARNGSLNRHITDASCGLNWRERYRIIKGICEGLCFLHQNNIIHLDMKPDNILLDSHMIPKITDFGLSRRLGKDQTRAITQNIFGTRGYADPEYLKTGEMVLATDIYSLGVIIMEILIGERRYPGDESLIESWMNNFEGSDGDMEFEQVRGCIKIGMECMGVDPKKRPVAEDIIDRLDKMASAEYSHESVINSSLVEPQVSLPREQFGERIGKHAAKRVQKADVEENSEILEAAAERLEWLHFQEAQQKIGQLSLLTVQDTKETVNHHGASNSSSMSTGFSEKNILDLFNWKARTNFDRNDKRTQEKSHFISIFKKEELEPILSSRNFIGKGAFAEVYKGVLHNALVAVKKTAYGNVDKNKKLENELAIQSQIVHKNIVWLIGCCLEMGTPVLVYEFLPRGSLHDILHCGSKVRLNLDVRLNIIAESAQGLAYLHSQARTKICHGDIKPESILLDDYLIPKISDFGLSRVIVNHKKHAYMDPLYLQRDLTTEKSDVYSFGIVILEVISRKKASHSDDFSLVKSFLEVHKQGKKATDLFDKEIAVTGDFELLDCLTEIAMECLNLDVDQRPSMVDVAERLLILNRSHMSHARHIVDKTTSADHSVETDVSNLLVQQKKAGKFSLLGVQDTNRHGTSISSSISTRFYKLNNLDIFNKKSLRNIGSNSRRTLENSSFIKIFRKEQVISVIEDSNFIGEESFFAVYKGVVDNAVVTVKKPIIGSMLELRPVQLFENQVIIQSQVVHKNILRLIGCCLEMDNLVLVYEFLSGGSLHDILHSSSKVPLLLDVRLNIVSESANGLAYLHSQAHTKILHGHVTPKCILLDENFMPKVADFRFSRLIARDKHHTAMVIGEHSYTDPFYMQSGLVTEKSDVYSFGIVILEVISRKKATHSDNHSLVNSFREVHEKEKKPTELFDKEIAVTGNLEILDYLAEIAVQCLNLDVDQRPTMTYVAERLLTLQRYRRSQVVDQ